MLKKLFTFSLIFIGALTLTACDFGDDGLTVEEILANISEAVDELDLPSTTSTDLTLPNTGVHEVEVTWESSDEDFITDAGVVTIPTLTEGDQTVTMTASLTLEDQTLTKTFTITVTAATALNDAEKVAADTLNVFVAEGETFDDVVLPTAGANGTTVTWSSSHPLVITDAGVVTRPASDATNVTVTLTATITIGSESETKTFDLIVVKNVDTIDIATLKAGYAAATITKGDNISIKGIVTGLVTVSNMGFYVYDGTGFLFIYTGSTTPTVEIGDVVLLQGTFDNYFGLSQLKELTTQEEIAEVITAPAPAVKTIQEIIDYTTSPDPAVFNELLSLTGTITMTTTDYYLEDEDGNKLELNDESDVTLLEALVGKNVTVTVTYHTYHSGHGFHQVTFSGFATDVVENVLSNADALFADLVGLNLLVPAASVATFVLPTTGVNGTVFSGWTSSNTAVFTDAGIFVARALTTVTVTFTGTATKGSEASVATFEVVVPLALSLGAAAELDKDEYVEVTGVVYYESYYGFHIFANDEYIFINDDTYLDDIAVGDELTIIAQVHSPSHGAIRLLSISYTNNSSSNTLPTTTVVELGDVVNVEYPIGMLVTVTGKIVEVASGSYTDLYIEDAAGNQIQVHYMSHDYILDDFKDQIVTVDMLVYGTDYIWFNGAVTDVTVVTTGFTESQQAYAVAAALIAGLGDVDALTGDLTLPLTFTAPAATATWATTDATVVTDAGIVTMPYGNEGYATLTVSVTVGTTTVDKEVHITVLDGDTLIPTDVATALLEDDGTVVVITGVVTGFYYGAPQVQDALTGIAIQVYEELDDEVEIGDLVIIRGTLDSYENMDSGDSYVNFAARRLIDAVVIEVVSSGNAVLIREDVTLAEITADYGDYYGQLITMTLKIKTIDDGHGYMIFEGFSSVTVPATIDLKIAHEDYYDLIYSVGDELEVTFWVYQIHYANLRLVNGVFPELTEAQDLLVAKGSLSLPETTTSDLTLDVANADFNATIVWASDLPLVITTAGVVTRPLEGSPDVDVTLTASVTVGTTTEDVVFVVTVTAIQPAAVPGLFISEYVEGGGSNKVIELYNPTDSTIDLSTYSLVLYSNGAITASSTQVLSGMLAPGETFVIVNAGAIQVFLDEADLTSGTINHNGDDTYGLFNGATLIDTFGIIGNTNDNYFAKDKTLVRNQSVVGGNLVYDVSEWTEYAKDTATYVGDHTCDLPTT